MTSLADRTITVLRNLHDELAGLLPTLTETQLTGPSGASEWTVAQVLSHLGSGSEIALASYQAALEQVPGPGHEFNQRVWGRWDSMGPEDQANAFLNDDAQLVEAMEALTPDQRENLHINLGFLPNPIGVATMAGIRLNEVALHGWDVRIAVDPTATLSEDAATVLVEQFSGGMGFMLGHLGKAEYLPKTAVVDVGGHGLQIAESVTLLSTAEKATATFFGPLEAFVRLLGGRLAPAHTPKTVRVDGNVSLDDLRRVFPGF